MSATRLLMIVLVFAGLPSCNSFNRYDIRLAGEETTTSVGKKAKDTALATASLSDEQIHQEPVSPLAGDAPKKPAVSANCPVYRLPDLGTAPDLPYDQLDAMRKRGDPTAFDQAAENQIKELYRYISFVKHTLRDSHQQYLKDCQNYLNGLSSNQNSLGQ